MKSQKGTPPQNLYQFRKLLNFLDIHVELCDLCCHLDLLASNLWTQKLEILTSISRTILDSNWTASYKSQNIPMIIFIMTAILKWVRLLFRSESRWLLKTKIHRTIKRQSKLLSTVQGTAGLTRWSSEKSMQVFCFSQLVSLLKPSGSTCIGLFTNFVRPVFQWYFLNHLVFHTKTSWHYWSHLGLIFCQVWRNFIHFHFQCIWYGQMGDNRGFQFDSAAKNP